MSTNKRTPIVLAFSGGLDTSYCVLELKAQGYDVHTVFVDTGGLSADEAQAGSKTARFRWVRLTTTWWMPAS